MFLQLIDLSSLFDFKQKEKNLDSKSKDISSLEDKILQDRVNANMDNLTVSGVTMSSIINRDTDCMNNGRFSRYYYF